MKLNKITISILLLVIWWISFVLITNYLSDNKTKESNLNKEKVTDKTNTKNDKYEIPEYIQKEMMSVLASTVSSTSEVKKFWLCDDKTTFAVIKYDPITDTYHLTCEGWNVGDTLKEWIKWIIPTDCSKTKVFSNSPNGVCYKVNCRAY